ncbi:hypothetical protein VTN96DRAFT_5992 [Rasamsonia emersonii]
MQSTTCSFDWLSMNQRYDDNGSYLGLLLSCCQCGALGTSFSRIDRPSPRLFPTSLPAHRSLDSDDAISRNQIALGVSSLGRAQRFCCDKKDR